MGEIEETVGNVTGIQSLKTSGQERRAQGDTEYKEAQTQGYAEGFKDRAVGKKDQLSGAVTGDTTQEASGMYSPCSVLNEGLFINHHSGRARNEQGKTQQDWNKS